MVEEFLVCGAKIICAEEAAVELLDLRQAHGELGLSSGPVVGNALREDVARKHDGTAGLDERLDLSVGQQAGFLALEQRPRDEDRYVIIGVHKVETGFDEGLEDLVACLELLPVPTLEDV